MAGSNNVNYKLGIHMKALYYDGCLKYTEEYPVPTIGAGESLIKIIISAICNTDKEILRVIDQILRES